jgi:tetratricopeptide (TPR) repeat protein
VLTSAAGRVDVDLGSVDGVTQGSELRAFRGRDERTEIGGVTITTVFRERSRGRTSDHVQPGDSVHVSAGTHVSALLAQAVARQAAGDSAAARSLAGQAAIRADDAEVPADVGRRVREFLGTLDHKAGNLDEAGQVLGRAAENFDAAPAAPAAERARILNELGAVQIEKRDYAAAEQTLARAEPFATGTINARVLNNLGAVAALRGDRQTAERRYHQAQALADSISTADRSAIDGNLRRLAASR